MSNVNDYLNDAERALQATREGEGNPAAIQTAVAIAQVYAIMALAAATRDA